MAWRESGMAGISIKRGIKRQQQAKPAAAWRGIVNGGTA